MILLVIIVEKILTCDFFSWSNVSLVQYSEKSLSGLIHLQILIDFLIFRNLNTDNFFHLGKHFFIFITLYIKH